MREGEEDFGREDPVGVVGPDDGGPLDEGEDALVGGADHLQRPGEGFAAMAGVELHAGFERRDGVVVQPQGPVAQERRTAGRIGAHERPFGDDRIVGQLLAGAGQILQHAFDHLAGCQPGFGVHRARGVVGDREGLGVLRIDRAEEPQHVEVQQGAQRQRLAAEDGGVAGREERFPAVERLEQLVAVQDQGVGLVPRCVEAVAPVVAGVVVAFQIGVVAPFHGVVADLVGAAHHLDHLGSERTSVEFRRAEFDVDAVEQLLESLLRAEELLFGDLVVGLYVEPVAAGAAERRCGGGDQTGRYEVFHGHRSLT